MVSLIAKGLNLEGLFRNIGLIRTDGLLSVAALLLFGKYPQRWLPVFTVKCVSFYGNELSGTEFRDKMDSPETLPKGLDVEDIKHGTSLPHNVLLFSNAIFLLPYTGIGSGIIRALQYDKNIIFDNDENRYEFMITIHRKDNIKVEKSIRVSELTNKQKDVVQFCSVPRTNHEILEHLGITYHSKNITKYVTNLVTHKFLKMMNSDPNASNQKYIKA
jgi:ATP-dependent DNA helicase RecG